MQNIKFKTISEAVLLIFNPLILPIYFMAVLLFGDSSFIAYELSIKSKVAILTMLTSITFVIPISLNTLLKIMEIKLKSQFFKDNYKFFSLLFIAILYIIAMLALMPFLGAYFSKKIFFSLSMVYSLSAFLMLRVPISTHSISTAAITTLFVAIDISGIGDMSMQIVGAMLLSGIVSTASLQLKKTTIICSGYSYLLAIVSVTLCLLF